MALDVIPDLFARWFYVLVLFFLIVAIPHVWQTKLASSGQLLGLR